MLCGSCTRTLETASRTSATARSIGVPMLNWIEMLAWPSGAQEVMLSMLPMPATAPSTFWMTCVSSSCGEAPGCAMVTFTSGKEMSGSSVIGSRMNAAIPMKNSTTNSITGGSGCRMAMRRCFSWQRGLHGFRDGLDRLAVAQEAAGGLDHTLIARDAGGEYHAVRVLLRDAHRPARHLPVRIDHQYVAAFGVGEHGGLRQYWPPRPGDGHFSARERAGSQRRIRREGDTDVAEARQRIDDCTEQADLAVKGARQPRQIHRRRLTDLHLRQILFGDLAAHLHLATACHAEQRFAARVGDLADLNAACQDGAGERRHDAGAREPRLRLGELRRRYLDAGGVGHRGGAPLLDVLRRQCP